jgi:hypothetical protein
VFAAAAATAAAAAAAAGVGAVGLRPSLLDLVVLSVQLHMGLPMLEVEPGEGEGLLQGGAGQDAGEQGVICNTVTCRK